MKANKEEEKKKKVPAAGMARFYDLFIEDTIVRVNSLKDQINNLEATRADMGANLKKFNADWYFRLGLPTRNLDKITWEMLESHKNSSDSLIAMIKGYISFKELIDKKTEILYQVQQDAVTRPEFYVVVEAMWKEIKKGIIKEGLIFKPPYNQPIIAVSWHLREGNYLDRRSTILKAKELKDKGIALKTKETPDGEEFRVYYDPLAFYINVRVSDWSPGKKAWSFRPLMGRRSLPKYLYDTAKTIDYENLYLKENEKHEWKLNEFKENYIRL